MLREGLGIQDCELDPVKRTRRTLLTKHIGKKVSDFLHGVRSGRSSATFRKGKTGNNSTLDLDT